MVRFLNQYEKEVLFPDTCSEWLAYFEDGFPVAFLGLQLVENSFYGHSFVSDKRNPMDAVKLWQGARKVLKSLGAKEVLFHAFEDSPMAFLSHRRVTRVANAEVGCIMKVEV